MVVEKPSGFEAFLSFVLCVGSVWLGFRVIEWGDSRSYYGFVAAWLFIKSGVWMTEVGRWSEQDQGDAE